MNLIFGILAQYSENYPKESFIHINKYKTETTNSGFLRN